MISATNWTWEIIDALEYSKLNALLEYWNERPPMGVVLQGIATALGAQFRVPDTTNTPAASETEKTHTTGLELLGIMRQSGLPFGVSHGRD